MPRASHGFRLAPDAAKDTFRSCGSCPGAVDCFRECLILPLDGEFPSSGMTLCLFMALRASWPADLAIEMNQIGNRAKPEPGLGDTASSRPSTG